MTVQEALQKLKEVAALLTETPDVNKKIIDGDPLTTKRMGEIIQYYDFIYLNAPGLEGPYIEAIDIVADMADNESIEDLVEYIVSPARLQTVTKSAYVQQQTIKDRIDPTELHNTITSYTQEIESMQSWDPDKVGDIKFALEKHRRKLLENKDEFDKGVYTSLLEDIDDALAKIDRFEKMINSDEFASLMNM